MRAGVTQDLQTAFAMGNDELLVAMNDPEVRQAWVAAVKHRLTQTKFGVPAPCTRTMRMLAEIWKLVGPTPALTVNLIAELGASSELEARRAIAMVNEAEATPLETQIEEGCRWIVRVLNERPDLQGRVMELLRPALQPLPQLEAHANGEAK